MSEWILELARRPGARSRGRPEMYALAVVPRDNWRRREAVEIDRETYELLMARIAPNGGRDWRDCLIAANGRRRTFLDNDVFDGQRQWDYVQVVI
ncbi:MAG: hypothetical protein D6706_07410 [Chloroflexi bacterium]|nr:MAG: hypothetical protein D6706_07410 [Chloroflexota bacterium]